MLTVWKVSVFALQLLNIMVYNKNHLSMTVWSCFLIFRIDYLIIFIENVIFFAVYFRWKDHGIQYLQGSHGLFLSVRYKRFLNAEQGGFVL